MAGPLSAKVCVACGRDCSTRRREKRADGAFVCHECLRRDRTLLTARVAPSPLPADHRPVEVVPEEAPAAESLVCDICSRRLSAGETYCALCHYDAQKGVQPGVFVGGRAIAAEDLTCRCGYDLHGLRQMRCPECGRAVRPKAGRDARESYFGGLTRRETNVSIGMVVGGLALGALIRQLTDEESGAIVFIAGYLMASIIGAGVYAFCSWVWLGADYSWPAIGLRLAGAFAVSDFAAAALGAALGVSMLGWLVPAVLLGVFFWCQLGLELVDAVLSAFFVHVARMAVIWGLIPTVV